MVESDCWIGSDRKICSWGWRHRVEGFYVNPKSGLLSFVPRQSARQRKKERLLRQEIDEVKLDPCHSYKLIEGQWYWVGYEYINVGRGGSRSQWDVVQRQHVKLIWGCHRIAISKRQCNREEVQWIQARITAWEKEVRRM
jgi:hypothetical protein